MSEFDRLDDYVHLLEEGDEESYLGLSTSEQLFVLLAANRADLLAVSGYTVAYAIRRIGPSWVEELVNRYTC